MKISQQFQQQTDPLCNLKEENLDNIFQNVTDVVDERITTFENGPLTKTVLVIGSSNMRGMAQRLNKQGITATGTIHSGAPTQQITSEIKKSDAVNILKSPPTYIVLHSGGIDARNHNNPVNKILRQMDTLIDTVKDKYKKSKLLITGLSTEVGSSSLKEKIMDINKGLIRICAAETNSCYIDCSIQSLKDSIHFSEHSKDLIARHVCDYTKSV